MAGECSNPNCIATILVSYSRGGLERGKWEVGVVDRQEVREGGRGNKKLFSYPLSPFSNPFKEKQLYHEITDKSFGIICKKQLYSC